MNDKIKGFVFVEKDDTNKCIMVKTEYFRFPSNEATENEKKINELCKFAKTNNYKIICEGKVVYDPFKILSEELLEEIKQKDITKLTEDEIVFLAQSRAYGDYVAIHGPLTIDGEAKFEDEYQKIKDTIEQINSGNVPSNEQFHRPHM